MENLAEVEIYNTSSLLGNLTKFEEKNIPNQIFLQGEKSYLRDGKRVAVVGSRKASNDGLNLAKSLTMALVEKDVTVVSGLAIGIDTVAHETAIEYGGKTIAVLGTPLSEVYPLSNKSLLEKIKNSHLALSQFPKGYPSSKKNFPLRNRTMALISDATIVVEASEQSGTRHQVWESIRLGRLVYILENVANNPELTWPEKSIHYGAQVLNLNDIPDFIDYIPYFTSGNVSEF